MNLECESRKPGALRHAALAGALASLIAPWASAGSDTDWPSYGNTPGGMRYAPLVEIDRDNVARLEEVWRYRTGDLAEGFRSREKRAFQATPLLVDGRLYFSTPSSQIHALDAETGERLWRHDTEPPRDRNYAEHTSRGVAYWRDDDREREAHCAQRILYATLHARLIALDALTGEPCRDFGEGGEVDLHEGVRPRDPGGYTVSSPPAVAGDRVIVGSAIGDNRAVDVASGQVRAFDVVSGALAWSWDPIPRDQSDPAYEEWTPEAAERTGAANAWAPLSVDEARGLVFVPTSSPAPDFYGGGRPGDNRHADSVVALDAASGELSWARQLVRHNLWDYDVPAQPVLIELERDGERIPALVQATKMGMLFVLHRETGEALFPIDDRPVPQSDVPGEATAATQPFSSLPPLVDHGPLTGEDAWGLTFWDRGRCRALIERHRSEGIFTPPSLEGTIVWPGFAGGSNWGSVAFDPERQRVIANVNHLAFLLQLVPRETLETLRGAEPDWDYGAQEGARFAVRRRLLESPLGLPCTAPPWGTLAAVDLAEGRIDWQVPLGTTRDLAPWPFWWIRGVPNMGGPVATAGGLVFIGAAADDYLRAFDVDSGEELWRGRLPAGGQATPMTYRIDGRQYVVIAAGGHGRGGTTAGDYVVAFALAR